MKFQFLELISLDYLKSMRAFPNTQLAELNEEVLTDNLFPLLFYHISISRT